jgi:hypothetical protein
MTSQLEKQQYRVSFSIQVAAGLRTGAAQMLQNPKPRLEQYSQAIEPFRHHTGHIGKRDDEQNRQ